MRSILALTAALFVLPACESVESGDIDTSGIWAGITVVHDGSGSTRVDAELKTGGGSSNTWLQLTDGDRLEASLNGSTAQRMSGNELLDRFWYVTNFDQAPDDALITVAFQRAEKDSAPESQVRMPLNFALNGPTAGARFTVGTDAIPVTWSNTSGDDFELIADGTCVEHYSKDIGDTGSFEIAATGLVKQGDDPGCEVTIELIRRRGGSVDSAFKGGRIVAEQRRTVKVQVTHPAPVEE